MIIEQARALRESGHPQRAYSLLCEAGEGLELQTLALVAAEKQTCLLAMAREGDWRRRLLLFNGALMLFYQITDVLPTHRPAYECQAAFWELMGDFDRGKRLRRTWSALCNEPDDNDVPTEPQLRIIAPAWHCEGRTPRILFVVPPRPHYGLDVLYDGLCTVLGDELVIDFPWKHSLHGAPLASNTSYPCASNRRGERLNPQDVIARLKAGQVDAVLWGDFDQAADAGMARAISEAADNTPFFIIDAEDECTDRFDEVLASLGRSSATGYFKREMLACVDYGKSVAPMPFAYPDRLVLSEDSHNERSGFFWAGQRWCGLRDIYLRRIESMTGQAFTEAYEPAVYQNRLRQAAIGFSGFGAGFDTVRYWELPAQGCMLLSQRSPLTIPHNFVDGESAVFFDDLRDLEEKLAHYLAHRQRVAEIAREGRRHLLRYHTASARARQLLGHMDAMQHTQRKRS